ncbi:MAG: hypothetical protein LBD12_01970 [Clostridiales Family XIII bacterium]|jgi:hypothetical protein|nr:hypothetical protein [Clostridiales Family XIII bacterium]
MDTTIRIGGKEFPFDALDVDFYRRYTDAEAAFQAAVAAGGGDETDCMEAQADAGHAFLDAVFGAGSADAAFGGKRNLRWILEAYKSMAGLAKAQFDDFERLVRGDGAAD